MGLIKKFNVLFFEPDESDHYIIEKWKKEADEADRLKELHRVARKQINKKNKTLSSNF